MNKSAALLLALTLCSAQTLAATAAKPCSTAQLKGGYALLLSGTSSGGLFCSSIGTVRFDGKGRLTSRAMLNCGTGPVETSNTGTYTVTADCTGTVTMNATTTLNDLVGDALSGETDYAISIGNAGQSVFFAITSPTATSTGTGIRH